MTCAPQPLVREITKIGVNIAVGIRIWLYATALNQSRLANMRLRSHIVLSMRSATRNPSVSPFCSESLFATDLITALRGSATV